jgi:putative transposase
MWKINDGYERDAIQRNFLKFISQTIKRDVERNPPESVRKILCRCKRQRISPGGYRDWKRNPLSVDLWTKEVFMQKMEYIHNNPVAAGLCVYPEDYKYSSAKLYATGEDEFGIITHWMA